MNSPFPFWKLFESSAQSGNAIESTSHATNSITPARATHASRDVFAGEIRLVAGIVATVMPYTRLSSRARPQAETRDPSLQFPSHRVRHHGSQLSLRSAGMTAGGRH